VKGASLKATFYNQHLIVAERKAAEAKNKQIRQQLGDFIAEGLSLMKGCTNNCVPPQTEKVNDWAARIAKFLKENLGQSYETRLWDPAGVPVNVACQGADTEHNNLYRTPSFALIASWAEFTIKCSKPWIIKTRMRSMR
jgi:hypothetical protein